MEYLKVSQTARALNVSATFLRRAEQEGRLPRALRNQAGWRVYSSADIELLRKILAPR